MWNNCTSHAHWQVDEMVQPVWKSVWWFLIKLCMHLPYKSMILFLEIYPRETKKPKSTERSARIFIATLFIVAPNWKLLQCPSIRPWVILEYYSAIQRNKLLILSNCVNKAQTTMLRKEARHERVYIVWVPSYEVLDKAKLVYCEGNQAYLLLEEQQRWTEQWPNGTFCGWWKCSLLGE